MHQNQHHVSQPQHQNQQQFGEHVKEHLTHYACEMKHKSCSLMDKSSDDYMACMKEYKQHCEDQHKHPHLQKVDHEMKQDVRKYHLSHEHYL